ncbi:hypothetical protein E2C01_040362 [Portunus trituberculatus]|uniref:Uncharacterized protein n=1 Tax=Portunus trituberculatus TaxID=210409 RepID=A0A5B7FP09_PORTR|nr:hypothetical protein [Portunus trituberculatus]
MHRQHGNCIQDRTGGLGSLEPPRLLERLYQKPCVASQGKAHPAKNPPLVFPGMEIFREDFSFCRTPFCVSHCHPSRKE